ncbi:MAG: T9SS type A sorting domain-containing protein [Cyanobacteria bacterium P01_F01_bin.150]
MQPQNDRYEDNDIRANATSLVNANGIWLEDINGLGILNGSDSPQQDWYEIQVQPGDTSLIIDLQSNHVDTAGISDLNLELWNTNGFVERSNTTIISNERIRIDNPASGSYFVGVLFNYASFVDPNIAVPYNLRWNSVAGSQTLDDAYENNNTLSNAYDLTTRERTWLSNIHGLGVQNDDDWYEIDITEGYERLVVDLTFQHAEGDIDLHVYDQHGNRVIDSNSITDNESIDTILPSSGKYYLKVDYGDQGNTYDLWWDDLQNSDDNYEQNNSLNTAYDLSNKERTWLSSINGLGSQFDDDWYEIEVNQGYERLVVDLTFQHAEGDIDLHVYDQNGRIVTRSESTTDNESIDTVLPDSGTYYLKVDYGNQGNQYDLRWDDLPNNAVDLSGKSFDVVQSSPVAGGEINVNFEIQNTGSSVSGNFNVDFYLSKDRTITPSSGNANNSDLLLGSYQVNRVAANSTTDRLTRTLTLPDAFKDYWDARGDGRYHIGMVVDANNQITETNENNNRQTALGRDYDSINVEDTQKAWVEVTIHRARGDFDGRGAGASDFFSRIWIDGKRWTSPKIAENNEPEPTNWKFRKLVSKPQVPIKVGLWDDDSIKIFGVGKTRHQHIDINPVARPATSKDFALEYDVSLGQASYGVRKYRQGEQILATGRGPDDNGDLWFSVKHYDADHF